MEMVEVPDARKQKGDPVNLSDGTKGLVQRIFQHAKGVSTPIQLTAFAIALITTVVLSKSHPGGNVLVLMILLFPFFVLILVFNEKVLTRLLSAGYQSLAFVTMAIVGSFLLSGFVFTALVGASSVSLVDTPEHGLLGFARAAKTRDIDDARFKLASYSDSYKTIASYYLAALDNCVESEDAARACDTSTHLRSELGNITAHILKTRRSALGEIYGDSDLTQEVLKLQQSVTALDSAQYFWDVVLRIYGSRGPTFSLSEIVDTRDWRMGKAQLDEIDGITFSGIEADLIRALGRDILVKPVDGFKESDIERIRSAFRSLGFLSEASNSVSSVDLLNRYRNALRNYFTDDQLLTPFYKLAFEGMESQMAVYLALYDTGLLDMRRFLLKYAPEAARQPLLDLMATKITPFRVDDVNMLVESITQLKRRASGARDASNVVLMRLRDELQNGLRASADVDEVLTASTVEDYFVRSLKVTLRRTGGPR